jgi:hypothetical protein
MTQALDWVGPWAGLITMVHASWLFHNGKKVIVGAKVNFVRTAYNLIVYQCELLRVLDFFFTVVSLNRES